MIRPLIGLAFGSVLFMGALESRAQAGDNVSQVVGAYAQAAAIGWGAVDLGFTSYDVLAAARRQAPSGWVLAPEILLNAPASVLLFILASEEETARPCVITVGVWSSLLVFHGLVATAWMISSDTQAAPKPKPTHEDKGWIGLVVFAPTLVGDGSHLVPGLGVAGRF